MVRETIDFMIKNKTELTRYQPVHGYYPDEFAMFTLLKYKDFELFTKSLKPTFEFICYAEYVEEENPTFGDRVSTCRAIEFGTVEEFQRALSLAMAGESTGFIRKISDGEISSRIAQAQTPVQRTRENTTEIPVEAEHQPVEDEQEPQVATDNEEQEEQE
ncbi:hypothetical protein HDV02_001759 [Globomyces sp. JEL0801]|nr:hypothetical protein HDV02_001759 [Globomyces sp. JEL0801]